MVAQKGDEEATCQIVNNKQRQCGQSSFLFFPGQHQQVYNAAGEDAMTEAQLSPKAAFNPIALSTV